MNSNEMAAARETQRYVIGECVGRGGGGSVYRAWDGRLGRWVAVKRLSNTPGISAEESEARISREANTLAALQHSNIVTVYDFGSDEAGPFVVMEFIEGETLAVVVEQAPFDLESFLVLAEQSLAGLAAAHGAHLLHRDMKPGNVMLAWLPGGGFQVKILDFGLAKFSAHPQEQTIDQGNALLGSIHCMAPEQFRREPLDARTDLYALGCVFYYTLAGLHPFNGETVAEVMASHLQGTVAPLDTLRPDLPEPVCHWVMRLLSLSPGDRPAGAAEAAAILRGLTRAVGSGTGPVQFAASEIEPARRRVPVLALAGVAALLVAAGVAASVLFTQGKSHLPAIVPVVASAKAAENVVPPPPKPVPAMVAPTPAAVAAAVLPVSVAPVALPVPSVAKGDAAPVNSSSAESIDANDIAALHLRVGQPVEVHGTPTGCGQSKAGTVLFLNFARPHMGLTLVFFTSQKAGDVGGGPGARSLEDIQPFVGHPLKVSGQVSDHAGDIQIVIKDMHQITPLQ